MGIWNNWNNSGLGDYVHRRSENYRNYGIYRNFGESISLSEAINEAYNELNTIRDKIANRSSQGQAKIIEDFYNDMLNHNYKKALNDPGLTEWEIEDIQGFISSHLLDGVKGAYQGDESNLTLRPLASANRIAYSGLKNKKTRSIKISTLIKIKKAIDDNLKILTKNYKIAKSKGVGKNELIKIVKLRLEFKRIKELLDEYIKQDQYLISFRHGGGEKNPLKDGKNNLLGDILTELDILSKAAQKPNLKDLGIYAENWTAIAGSFAGKVADWEASKIVKDFTAPGKKENGGHNLIKVSTDFIDTNSFAKKLTEQAVAGNSWKAQTDGAIISTQTTEDTVDVTLKFEEPSEIFNLQQVSMSVKNYFNPAQNSSEYKNDGIHIISGVPLTVILSLVNSNFSNHYLNLLAAEEDYNSSDFVIADNFLKYAAAVRALTNARYSSFNKLSDYFIVNSQLDKHIYVFSTSQLLKDIMPTAENFNYNMIRVDEETWPIAGSLHSINVYKDTVQERITNIFMGAHRFKLSLSLKPWGAQN